MKAPFLLALLLAPLALLLAPLAMAAAPPGILNTQGRIAVGGTNYDGTGHFKFALVDAAGTTAYWSNAPDTAPADGEPDAAVPVTVTNGHYSLLLGDIAATNMTTAIAASVFESNTEVFLRTWFGTGAAGPFEQFTPDRRVTSNAYALHAAKADGVPDGAITASMISPSVSFDDADADPSNELQTLSQAGTNVTLSNGGGTVSVADNDNSSTNEIQTLSRAGTNVTLSNGGGTVSVADNDNSSTNEIQTLSLAFDVLSISGGNSANLNQYFLQDGSEAFGGTLNLGGNDLRFAGGVSIGTNSPKAPLHLRSDPLAIPAGGAGSAVDALIEAADARLVLASDAVGSTGSTLSLQEWNGGTLVDTWAIQRQTTGGGSALRFAFTGVSPEPMLLTSSGNLELGGNYIQLGSSRDGIINFGGAGKNLSWDDADNRFEFFGDLRALGFQTSGTNTPYSHFSFSAPAPISGQMLSTGDVFIEDDLEVGDLIYGTLAAPSDRNIKEDFAAVDPARVLDKVMDLPITTWRYKDRHDERKVAPRHMGAVAQDFHAAFGLGDSDRHICSVDADGVALAAIQGLHAKVETESDRLRAENEALRERLRKLEATVQALTQLGTEN